MDFCLACRRPLNGAYSCPDCGTVADRSTPPGEAVTEQLPLVEARPDDFESSPRSSRRASHGAADGDPLAFSAHEPRRKRSRRARRQRALVLGIGGTALAGAAVLFTVAAFSGGSDGPAPPPGIAELPPVAPTGTPTSLDMSSTGAHAPGPRHTGSASPSDSGSGSPSATPSRHTAAPPASGGPTGSHPAPTTTSAGPTPTRTTTGAPPHSSPPTSKPPSTSPSPTPSGTCKPVLWWCQ